jgi:hypothetical protein
MKRNEGEGMTAEARRKISSNACWTWLVRPILGLVYVIALPFIGIGTILAMIAEKGLGDIVVLTGNLVSFGWRPSEAHLAGGKRGKKRNDNPTKQGLD